MVCAWVEKKACNWAAKTVVVTEFATVAEWDAKTVGMMVVQTGVLWAHSKVDK